MNSRPADKPPIFVYSCARSGSTLLRYIIDTHPAICCPPEISLGPLCEHLRIALDGTLGQFAGAEGGDERWAAVTGEIRRIVSGLMDSYAAAKRKPLWCEKSPVNLWYRDLLREVFPDAKYICLYRNCMDVAHSLIEFSRLSYFDDLFRYVQKNPRNLLAAMVDYWVDQTGRLLAFEREHESQCFRVKYESLVLYPRQTLGPLTEFLGVEWVESLLNDVFKVPHDQGGGDVKVTAAGKIHKSSIGSGSTLNIDFLPDEMLSRMNGVLEQLEYPTVGRDWNSIPSPYLGADSTTEESDGVVKVPDGLRSSRYPDY